MPYTSAQFLVDLESPFAWPGGYPRFFICDDGESLSFAAARDHKEEIVESIDAGHNSGWHVVGCDVNWEDTQMVCAHTNAPIESAYGE